MRDLITTGKDFIERSCRGENLRVEAWTSNCIRVRCTLENEFKPFDWVINEKSNDLDVEVTEGAETIVLRNGELSVEMAVREAPVFRMLEAPLRFYNSTTGVDLLREKESRRVLPDPGHLVKAVAASTYRAEARFQADPEEKFYGLGQNQQNFFNQKGCTLEMKQMNTHTIIPVVYSSKGYGFFWNNPAYGRIEMANNGTYWIAEQTDQLDYFVFTGDNPAEIMEAYAKLTGYPSMMPDWAMGFWQCKLRYRNREELMEVAREHKKRGLPMSVIVIDFFHWEKMGEFDFDPKCWPDPEGMIGELKDMGIETMVSIWPTVNPNSKYFSEMFHKAYIARTDKNVSAVKMFTDTYDDLTYLHIVDFTNPDAQKFVWDLAKKNYYDRGVRTFWLDVAEPDFYPHDTDNVRYYLGNGAKVSSLYPLCEERGFYEGMKEAGEEQPLNLCRSAWAGSQKYGVCLWTGDIYSDFETLKGQVVNGLNVAMAGIPWWTTDIGGFFGGDIEAPEFRELIVRWFQWGVFCPIFRLHGFRNSWDVKNAGPNEVWSFGEEAYEIIKGLLFLRERLRPYIKEQMKTAHEKGTPPMRPLFFDFPNDKLCYDVEDQLLFGPDIMAAPVVEYKQRKREVYLPDGAEWHNAWTGEQYRGGRRIEVEAPLNRIPIFLRNGAKLPIRE